jgi:hypothetical protein
MNHKAPTRIAARVLGTARPHPSSETHRTGPSCGPISQARPRANEDVAIGVDLGRLYEGVGVRDCVGVWGQAPSRVVERVATARINRHACKNQS